MKKIKITSIPSGEAPEWVRKEWVGLEMPLGKSPEDVEIVFGVIGGPPDTENLGGYPVRTEEAIRILEKKSPAAATWWKERPVGSFATYLVFGKQFCKYIDTDEIVVAE